MNLEVIIKRLASFGYTFNADKDTWVVNFLMDKVTNQIRNEANIAEIPEDLYHVAVDLVVGEFIKMKKGSGDLDGFEVDLNVVALKSKSQGDTSFSFATDKVMSAEERLDLLIEHLLTHGNTQILRFRRFVW